MKRILLEGGIIVLLVLIGISVFIPEDNNLSNVIKDFETSVENGEIISDGVIADVEVNENDDVNFVSKINCKIGNSIVNGLNSIFELGMKVVRVIVN